MRVYPEARRTVWKLPFQSSAGSTKETTAEARTSPIEKKANELLKTNDSSSFFSSFKSTVSRATREKSVNRNKKSLVETNHSTSADVNRLLSMIPKKFLGDKMKETLSDLYKIAEGVYDRKGKEPDHPLVLNIALLRMYAIQSHEESQLKNCPALDSSTLIEGFAAKTLHYFKHASEVYGTDPTVRKQDIILNQLEDDHTLHMPRHMVFLDHVTQSIVVSIRGTQSLGDMITDLYIDVIPFLDPAKGVYAHRGIAQSAEALLPTVTKAINEIKAQNSGKYAQYQVVTTGHSLGAGTAALLSLLLSTQSKIAATCYAFAPPPVISHPVLPEGRFPFNFFNRPAPCQIHCFVHNRDFITRCSHQELLHLLSALTAVDSLPWSDMERTSTVYRGRLSDTETKEIEQALCSARKVAAHKSDTGLYLPGEIFVLRPIPSVTMEEVQQVPAAGIESGEEKEETVTQEKFDLWQQFIQKTVSAKGSGTIQSKSADPSNHESTQQTTSMSRSGRNASVAVSDSDGNDSDTSLESKEEAELERRKQEDRLQYELVRAPSPDSLFNGLLYYGDSMVHDHLLTSYRRALLKLIL
eukprot:CAMPEP_0170397376 /NCGR_PEP_ID=MMETSP0117_2-20130122/22842_1 /TAXON_ID=400756 /ORGANISM="Durinskia baltica, Strain CSIRO CS-38" /LENGTH=582 /DNA_ID=CAMNT_0010653875 /DNA_START=93 /DNA_END=1841 /DNA_ORIENTATION=-